MISLTLIYYLTFEIVFYIKTNITVDILPALYLYKKIRNSLFEHIGSSDTSRSFNPDPDMFFLSCFIQVNKSNLTLHDLNEIVY